MYLRRRSAVVIGGIVFFTSAFALLADALQTPAKASSSPFQTSQVYRWGSYSGGLYPAETTTPTPVPNLDDIVQIDAGNEDSYALQCVGGESACPTDGTVWVWGNDQHGQLGNGTKSSSTAYLHQPAQVQFPSGTNIVAIGEARSNGYAIDSTGQAWAWGLNDSGSLCIGNSTVQPTPVKVPGITDATAVQGGQNHVLWLLSDGTVVACGNNAGGDLGNGTLTSSSIPVPVRGMSNIVQISAGDVSSAAVDADGNLYMWGSNALGRLGLGILVTKKTVPAKVALPAPVEEVSAGGSIITPNENGSTIALLSDGSVYAWGCDTYGQLGDGHTYNQYRPIPIGVPAGVTFTSVVTGGYTSYGLDSVGNVWAWGWGNFGELGNGASGKSNVSYAPIHVDSGVDMISSTANNVVDHHTVG